MRRQMPQVRKAKGVGCGKGEREGGGENVLASKAKQSKETSPFWET